MELQALLNELDDVFPPATPAPADSISHIMYRAGQRSVVEWIEDRYLRINYVFWRINFISTAPAAAVAPGSKAPPAPPPPAPAPQPLQQTETAAPAVKAAKSQRAKTGQTSRGTSQLRIGVNTGSNTPGGGINM